MLSDLDTVPEDLENEVESQEDPEVLGIWLKLAARASSLRNSEKIFTNDKQILLLRAMSQGDMLYVDLAIAQDL